MPIINIYLQNLVKQCGSHNIPFLDDLPTSDKINGQFDLVVDAIFGFNFKGDLRAPFDKVLDVCNILYAYTCYKHTYPSMLSITQEPTNLHTYIYV
jgi:NAD(P)H-hydrate repair Nnr-like enzyme with NAD(P)H-hydrate epimerase domain